MFSSAERPQWVKCQDYGNELEASIAVAILGNAGIPSVIRSNDSVGLFGSAFQGFSAMGVSLMVPSPALAAARTVLATARAAAEDDGDQPMDDGQTIEDPATLRDEPVEDPTTDDPTSGRQGAL